MNTFRRVGNPLTVLVREHVVPLLILLIPLNLVVWQSDADNGVPFLVLPLVSIGIGYVLRPKHVWFVWLASVVQLWIVIGVWGKYGSDDTGETTASIMIEAIVWMVLGVLIPVWLGRRTRSEREKHWRPNGVA